MGIREWNNRDLGFEYLGLGQIIICYEIVY